MQKTPLVLILAFTVAICLLHQQASALGLEAAAGYWWQNPSGDIQLNGGDSLDLEDDFGYGRTQKPFGRLKIDLPAIFPNVYFMATPLEFDETTTTDFTFDFGGQTFSTAIPFRSKLRLDHYDITLFYAIPLLNTVSLGNLNVELGLEVRIMDFEVEVEQAQTTTFASERFVFPIPMIYAGVQFQPLKMLGFEAEIRGIAFRANDYIDIITRVKFKVVGPLLIAGGYRFERINIDYQDVEATLIFQGPFVEVGVSL